MSHIQQNRYDALLRRVADLKGGGSKVSDALTELFPMFDVENVPAELLLLGGSKLCVGGAQRGTGGVGTFQQTVLRNPVRSGIIATVLEVAVSSATAQIMNYGMTQNTFAIAGQTAFADGRVFGEGTVCSITSEGGLSVGPAFGRFRVNGSQSHIIHPVRALAVLSPNSGFVVSTTDDDTTFENGWTWIERIAEPSELNF